VELQARVREMGVKIAQMVGERHKGEGQNRMEVERVKAEAKKVEKEFIKAREAVEAKNREVIMLQEQVQKLS